MAIYHLSMRIIWMWRNPRRKDSQWRASVTYMSRRLQARGGRKLEQIGKAPGNNIYIGRCLIGEVAESAAERLRTFLDTAVYYSTYALECTIAGIKISLVCENVARAFWPIGGYAGHPLFTNCIKSAMSPTHAFSGCTSL